LADLEPGAYEVTASVDGYFTSDPQTVEVGDGEDVVGVDFALEAEAPPALIVPGPFTAVAEGGLLNAAGTEFPFTECPDGVPVDPEGECITLVGEVLDEDGSFVIPAENVDFPAIEEQIEEPIVVETSTSALTERRTAACRWASRPPRGRDELGLPSPSRNNSVEFNLLITQP
jgi:hypothetical protein